MLQIRIENLVKKYRQGGNETLVLRDIDLQIEPGEFFFLLGPSGCGKTTLLRIIAGLLEPSAGKILFDGKDVTNMPSDKRNCAMVFQNYALWPHMTVGKNVEFGPLMQKIDKAQRQKIAQEKLEIVKMAEYTARKSNQLSGGQQQRVALARALAANPSCLLLDEPLSNLDARLRAKMRVELRNLVKMTQTTAIYVTHDQNEALSMADRIAVLNQGQIVQIGTPEEIYNFPNSRFVADFIGEANFISGKFEKNNPKQITTEIGSITCNNEGVKSSGMEITCCVRPENIKITKKQDHAGHEHNIFPCKAGDVAYFGDTCQIELILNENLVWKMVAFAGKIPQVRKGQDLHFCINPDNIVLLEK